MKTSSPGVARFFQGGYGKLAGNAWVLLQKLIQAFPTFEVLQKDFEGNTSLAENGLPAEDVLVSYDRALHLGSPPLPEL